MSERGTPARIAPANLRDLPSVLDTRDVASVLRVHVDRVRELTELGRLRRLRYTRKFLYDAREVLRFLEEETGPKETEQP